MNDVSLTRHVADNIRALRATRRWSARQLAERCAQAGSGSLTRGTIAKIESGGRKYVTADELAVLAKVLEVSPSVLLTAQTPGAESAGPPDRNVARAASPTSLVPRAWDSRAPTATQTLPRDTATFTGREHELGHLMEAVSGAAGSAGVVGIHAIGGMPGVGKTTFAVHAAHQLAPRFPDGQIFLSLHGHTPGQRPVAPADALASLLLTAGVSVSQIPPGTEARMALWRDRLAGRQLLLLLDDAADSEQVRPLLPGTAGSLVLITSRRHLTALEDAQAISLDTLPPGKAAQLLIRLTARAGLDAGDPAVAKITQLCGYLPLAIGLLARQLHYHPAWTAAGLAEDLVAARDRLELMHAEALSVAAAFDLSYQELAPGQQRLFRRLSLHPGPDIDTYSAAALDGTSLDEARRHLDALYERSLISEPTRGRYRFHDLIREHARALAASDQPAERDAAVGRLLDYYQHTGAVAEALLARQTRPGPAPAVAMPPTVAPDLADSSRALAWVRAERANLLACLDHATSADQYARVAALTAAMTALLRHDGPWADAIIRHAAAATAAQRFGHRLGHANALNDLGGVRRLAGDYRGATQALEEALGIYHSIGDRLGQANALNDLGIVWQQTGDYPAAAQALAQALGIYHSIGDRLGQANALNQLGIIRQLTGEFSGAAQPLEEALRIYRDLGDRRGQANALNNLGDMRRLTGDYLGAAQALEEALDISRGIGNRLGQANALAYLGTVRRMTGDYPGAAKALEEALDLSRDLGDRLGQANALTRLGEVRRMTGDYPGAAQVLGEALSISRSIGDRGGEAEMLNEAGELHRVSGNLTQAEGCHQQALELARAIASPWDEANALAGQGRCALAGGDVTQAKGLLGQAYEIFQQIGAGEAPGIGAELDAMTLA